DFLTFFNTNFGSFKPYKKIDALLSSWGISTLLILLLAAAYLLINFHNSKIDSLHSLITSIKKKVSSCNPVLLISYLSLVLFIELWLVISNDDIWLRTITPCILVYGVVIFGSVAKYLVLMQSQGNKGATALIWIIIIIFPFQLTAQINHISNPNGRYGTLA